MKHVVVPLVLQLDRAGICLEDDCQAISDLIEQLVGCPQCAGTQRMPLTRWLGERRNDMSATYYVLGGPDGHTPVQTMDVLAWSHVFGTHVAFDELSRLDAVRTIFVGHGPAHFVTHLEGLSMAEHPAVGTQTWAEALAAHQAMVERWQASKRGPSPAVPSPEVSPPPE